MRVSDYREVYQATWKMLDYDLKGEIESSNYELESLPEILKEMTGNAKVLEFIPELARLEFEIYSLKNTLLSLPDNTAQYSINPSVKLLELSWKNLPELLEDQTTVELQKGKDIVILWKNLKDNKVFVRSAKDEDLLALKLVVEGYDLRTLSRVTNKPLWILKETIERAVKKGLLIKSESKIRRDNDTFQESEHIGKEYLVAEVFTLQWHITQACDLHCRHCYDRSDRKTLRFNDAIKILDDFYEFCEEMNVDGQVSFSGGNPFLHPRFYDIYEEAVKSGFIVAVLGNPVSKERLERLVKIKKPSFYQVSLEGLKDYNDYIRGKGHFDKTIEFLHLLRELNIYSMVMLTLNRDNIDQVIPLARELEGIVDSFTFNRLSLVGEGASLLLPDKDRFEVFLREYLEEAKRNSVVRLKDNLINIIRIENNAKIFGGCTGFGCGAAFNFVSLLPDGEVHACRKFPSLIGNIFNDSLINIYKSSKAKRYRKGSSECSGCVIRPVCGGCLAVAYSFGFDVSKQKDPFCFINSKTLS